MAPFDRKEALETDHFAGTSFFRSSLPIDALAEITNRLKARPIAYLWFCGSKYLNSKLSMGGALIFRFVARSVTFEPIWPSLANELTHLRVFKYVMVGREPKLDDAVANLLKLPRTVTHLSLSFECSAEAITLALSRHPSNFEGLQRLSLYIDKYENSSEARLQGILPSGLQKLHLEWNLPSSTSILDPRLSLLDLPPNLTILNVSVHSFDVLMGHKFPPTLTHLTGWLNVSHADWIKMLPSGLLKCHVNGQNDDFSAASLDWTCLPKTLTSFMTGLGQYRLTDSHLRCLPPDLTYLRIGGPSIESRQVALLPRKLKETSVLPSRIDQECFQHLPSTLESLRGIPATGLCCLPPSLTYFHSKCEPEDYERHLKAPLPETIRHLEVNTIDPRMLHAIPLKLIALTFDEGILTEEILKALPTTLKEIVSMGVQPIPKPECLQLFPPRIVHLDLISMEPSEYLCLPAESSSWLPRSVEYLSLGEIETQGPGWFSSLPPQLNELTLKIKIIYPGDMQDLSKSCPKLRSFTIRRDVEQEEEVSSFAQVLLELPHSLRAMDMRIRGIKIDIAADQLTQLPKHLKTLSIPSTVEPMKNCLSILPRSLTRFSVGGYSPDWFPRFDTFV